MRTLKALFDYTYDTSLKTSHHSNASSFEHNPTQNWQCLHSSSCLCRRKIDLWRTGGHARQQSFASSYLETKKYRRLAWLGLWYCCSIPPTTCFNLVESSNLLQIPLMTWVFFIASPGSLTIRTQILFNRLINCSPVSSGMCKQLDNSVASWFCIAGFLESYLSQIAFHAPLRFSNSLLELITF